MQHNGWIDPPQEPSRIGVLVAALHYGLYPNHEGQKLVEELLEKEINKPDVVIQQ